MASLLRNLSVRTFSPSRSNLVSCSLRRTSPAVPRFITTSFPATPTFTQRCTMATADAPKKMEWLVVVPDFAGAQEKRLAVRPCVPFFGPCLDCN